MLLLVSAMPHAAARYTADEDGIFYIISARTSCRFSAYMPHSLSHGDMPDRCLWIKSGEADIGIDHGRELLGSGNTEITVPDKFCTLLKAANVNHLSHCKREVYHLLI